MHNTTTFFIITIRHFRGKLEIISHFLMFTIKWAHSRHVKAAAFSPGIPRPLGHIHRSWHQQPDCLISLSVLLDPSRADWPHGQSCCRKALMTITSCSMWFQKGNPDECVLLWHVTLCCDMKEGKHFSFLDFACSPENAASSSQSPWSEEEVTN